MTLTEAMGEVRACIASVVEDRSRLEDLEDDTHLFESAVLDSVATVDLLVELEQQLGVRLDETAVFSPEFSSIRGIAGLVLAGKSDA
jgi:acyl carrier protein